MFVLPAEFSGSWIQQRPGSGFICETDRGLWPYKKFRNEDRLLKGDPLPSPAQVFPGDKFKINEILHLKAGQSVCY